MKIVNKLLCKIFGHKWSYPERVGDGCDMEWIEEGCERKGCPCMRQGQPGVMKTINPDNFLKK